MTTPPEIRAIIAEEMNRELSTMIPKEPPHAE